MDSERGGFNTVESTARLPEDERWICLGKLGSAGTLNAAQVVEPHTVPCKAAEEGHVTVRLLSADTQFSELALHSRVSLSRRLHE